MLNTQFNTFRTSEKSSWISTTHLLSHPGEIAFKVTLSSVVSKPSVKQSQHPKREGVSATSVCMYKCVCENEKQKARGREREKLVEPGLCSSPAHYIQLDSTAHPRNASPLNWHTIAHTHTSVAYSSYLASNTSFTAAASYCMSHNHMWGRCFYSPAHENIIGLRLAPDQAPCWHGDGPTQSVYRGRSRLGNPP